MLSDEEIKAIDYLQLCYDLSTITNESLSKLGIVLNLIKKQSKEIEELKNSDLTTVYLNGFYDGEKKVEDKIKAKIEPKLKELDEQMKKEWKEYGNSREYQDMEDEWNFLQSLLEKE